MFLLWCALSCGGAAKGIGFHKLMYALFFWTIDHAARLITSGFPMNTLLAIRACQASKEYMTSDPIEPPASAGLPRYARLATLHPQITASTCGSVVRLTKIRISHTLHLIRTAQRSVRTHAEKPRVFCVACTCHVRMHCLWGTHVAPRPRNNFRLPTSDSRKGRNYALQRDRLLHGCRGLENSARCDTPQSITVLRAPTATPPIATDDLSFCVPRRRRRCRRDA
ncbi:hypothetical protein BC834DRAFT_691613 [Gloeopeniophorella convolvens]|nr:hypothetical protein BC834DRAFT_691613 [Gloeopeniophorella convolvens]